MSKNGGYAIMDLKGRYFMPGNAVTIPDVFPITQRKKAVLISGLRVYETRYPDFYAIFTSTTADSVTTAKAEVRISGATIKIEITNQEARNVSVAVIADT